MNIFEFANSVDLDEAALKRAASAGSTLVAFYSLNYQKAIAWTIYLIFKFCRPRFYLLFFLFSFFTA